MTARFTQLEEVEFRSGTGQCWGLLARLSAAGRSRAWHPLNSEMMKVDRAFEVPSHSTNRHDPIRNGEFVGHSGCLKFELSLVFVLCHAAEDGKMTCLCIAAIGCRLKIDTDMYVSVHMWPPVAAWALNSRQAQDPCLARLAPGQGLANCSWTCISKPALKVLPSVTDSYYLK